MSQQQDPQRAYQALVGYAPQQGYAPNPGYSPSPGYVLPPTPMGSEQSSTVKVVIQHKQQTVAVGGCRVCGVGRIRENFTELGICLAAFFFPLGVLCCLLLTEKRCDRCGATF